MKDGRVFFVCFFFARRDPGEVDGSPGSLFSYFI